MGLIDSTNRIERAILTAKQEKAQERTEKKREKAIKDRDKLDLNISKELMQEALQEEIKAIYSRTDYNTATLFFKSIQSKELILRKIASNELEYKTAEELYYKILAKISKEYKAQAEYQQATQEMEELKKYHKNDVFKVIALTIYNIIIGIFKVFGFLILICMGFTKFIFMVQPQHKKRYK